MKHLGRLKSRLVLFVALMVPAIAASSAVAATPTSPWDPQVANVPQVAWRGEQVRLVKCSPVLANAANYDLTVEEWSGPGSHPTIERPTVTRLSPTCVAADIVTLDPGLARVKLVASNPAGTPILKHQFLVIWLSIGTPAIDEVGANDPTGTTRLGDPAGDGVFNAGGAVGRVQVVVKGTFPHPLGPGGTFTLPDDWATIAEALADDSDSNPDNDTGFWDIHDDRTKKEDHRPGSPTFCLDKVPVPPPAVDAVDNCRGAGSGELGPFSRFFGDGIEAAGPFDPNRPELTLLSDGKLDPDDAPMPAVRLDVSIAPNSGAATDIGGVGSLEKADKGAVYSRDGTGATTPHNLYAPFYGAYIPSTSRPGIASGVDGPTRGNNFRGFLYGGFYDYWTIAETFRTAVPTNTNCLRLVPEQYRQTPSGAQSVAVYTDEHGEAQVAYRPGTGFYFDNLPVVKNDNLGCDLEGIKVLGTSSISAVARYPYQPVSDPDKKSASLTKTVKSLFTKFVSYFPKGKGAANENARIVVAHAQDIDGKPFTNERVCFFVDDEADGAFGFTGQTGREGARLTVGGSPAPELGRYDVCRHTDANGNAAIEVINSDPQRINVTAYFVEEGLLRDVDVNFALANSSGGPNPPANGTSPVPPTGGAVSTPTTAPPTTDPAPSGDGGGGGGSAEVPKPLAGILPTVKLTPRASSKKAKVRAATLRTARISKKGAKKYLVINVKSQKKYETVKIRLIGKNGRTLKRWTRKCRANRTTKLRVSVQTRTAKVVIKK